MAPLIAFSLRFLPTKSTATTATSTATSLRKTPQQIKMMSMIFCGSYPTRVNFSHSATVWRVISPYSTSSAVNTPSDSPASTVSASNINAVSSDHYDDDDDEATALEDYQSLFLSQRAESPTPVSLPVVEGAIPADFPSGTYYLIGPGLFADDHGSTVHPFDAHGYLRAFSIDDGSSGDVRYSARYVETEAWKEEQEAGGDGGTSRRWKFRRRGVFSVLKGGKKIGNAKVVKNVANTTVVKWGTRLLCLWEGGVPYEVAPGTLDTIGLWDHTIDEDDFPNQSRARGRGCCLRDLNFLDIATQFLKPILRGVLKMPSKRILAHYKIDARRNRLILVSYNAEDLILPCSNFTFFELDTNFKLKNQRKFRIPEPLMIHDWAFTDSHYLIFGNRIKLDIPEALVALSGFSPLISAFSVDPRRQTSPLYVFPRFSGENITGSKTRRDWRVPIEAPSQHWLVHAANAFERRDDVNNLEIEMHATVCSYQWINLRNFFGYDWRSDKLDPASFMSPRDGAAGHRLPPHLVRVTLRMNETRDIGEYCSIEPLCSTDERKVPYEFPTINPKFSGTQNRYMYACTSSGSRHCLPLCSFDSVSKIDVIKDGTVGTWCVGHRRFVGEAIFVPKGISIDEDDGYLLLIEYAVSVHTCYLVVLDAKLIGKPNALVARLQVPKHLFFPLGFHGFWAPTN